MIDPRLQWADVTKLDELREVLSQQENADRLCAVEMERISIGHGTVRELPDAVRALSAGKRVLMVTGPTVILDKEGDRIKEVAAHRVATLLVN